MTGNFLSLGKGALSGACMIDGEIVAIIRKDGALHKKRIVGKHLVNDGVFAYAKDGFLFPVGKLTVEDGVKYEV
ncbi:MAG: hypothetical protein E7350_02255 [Clostridiales bacterium]|nr:hypothetical protein [Clostridiales bacterium]